MDLNKIGKFIMTIRKEKGLTQEQLGTKLGVSGKSVSKWERGINAPDIAILEKLSSELDVSINELLKGELSDKKIENLIQSKTTLDGIKFYSNNIKNNFIKKIILILCLVIVLFAVTFTITNYGRTSIYSIESDDTKLDIEGYVIFNQQENKIIINYINYVDEKTGTQNEPIVKNTSIILKSGEQVILKQYDEITNSKTLSEMLNKFRTNISGDKHLINKHALKDLLLIIEYEDIDDEYYQLKFDINAEKNFSNNKLFY